MLALSGRCLCVSCCNATDSELWALEDVNFGYFCFIGKWLNQWGQKAQELYYNMFKCVIILISLKSLKRLLSIRL